MNFTNRARSVSVALATFAVVAFVVPASAQDITDMHLKAARSAIAALHATDQFDVILPQAASALKSQLIQKNPDQQETILKVVDEKTLAMVSRRADLEKEIATAYARIFSEDDLKGIFATFYNSAPGKKLLSDGPIVTREVIQAAEIWQRGIARDLAQSVGDALQKEMPDTTPKVGEPVTPVAPAPAAGDGASKDSSSN